MPTSYPTAAWVRVEPRGSIWTVMIFDADNTYLGGADTAVGDVPEREQKLEVHTTLAKIHLEAGAVDSWEPGDGHNYLLKVVPF